MADTSQPGKTPRVSIRLMGLHPGASQDQMVAALQRLYRGKSEEDIRRALARLPLMLTRSVTEEQARKIRNLLEAKGAILEIAYGTGQLRVPQPPPPPPSEAPEAQPSGQAPSRPGKPKAAGVAGYTPPLPFGVAADAERPPEAIPSGVPGKPPGPERRSRPRIHQGIQLEPMEVGAILDRAFRLMQQQFWLFFIILLIPQGISFLAGKAFTLILTGILPDALGGDQTMLLFAVLGAVGTILTILIFLIVMIWAEGALIHAVSATYLGHSTSVGASYAAMRPRLGGLLGTMILLWFLVGLGCLLFVIPGILLLVSWLLADKVVVLEGEKGMSALRRSKELMSARTEPGFWKGPKIKASVILLVGLIIGIGIRFLFQAPGAILLFFVPENIAITTVQDVLTVAAEALATAYASVAMIIFYYDIRIRKEGFDLKMMAENL